MQKTGIEYLTDTWNPIAMRCTRCSPGCDRCWHLRTADRLAMNSRIPADERTALAGHGPFVLRERELTAPLLARKPSVVGVQFMGDLFHEAVPDDFRTDAFMTMALAARHTFLVLTKRPGGLKNFWEAWERGECNNLAAAPTEQEIGYHWPLPNVFLGITVCNQEEWDAKKRDFLLVPGLKFVSHEPALGLINFGQSLKEIACPIAGGETSKGARPSHPDIFRSDRDQCVASGTAFYFKQWGNFVPYRDNGPLPRECFYVGRDGTIRPGDPEDMDLDACMGPDIHKTSGHFLDGKIHDALPWRNVL